MKKTIGNIFLCMFFGTVLCHGQNIRVSGYVNDSLSGEPLLGANIINTHNNTGTTANNYGFYSIHVDGNIAKLVYSFIGYEDKSLNLKVHRDTTVNITLNPGVVLDEIVIAAGSAKIAAREQMSLMHVQISDFKILPSLGVNDAIKSLQLLPGINTGGEGQSGLNIRGGSHDQSLFLMDGVELYHVNHLGNYLSVFETEALKDIKLYKGAFPARYGSRLSSVIDIRTKDGNKYSTHGNFSMGLLSASALLEGPIVKGKSSYLLSFRRFWPDLLMVPITKAIMDGGVGLGYNFYDNIVKVNHEISDKDKVYISFYGGRDAYRTVFDDETGASYSKSINRIKWGNKLVSGKWTHLYGPSLFSEITIGYANYSNSNFAGYEYEEYDPALKESSFTEQLSSINDYSLKADFEYSPLTKINFRFGGGSVYHIFNPGTTTFIEDLSGTGYSEETTGNDNVDTFESFLYLENEISPTDYFTMDFGARWSGYGTPSKFYNSLEPRLSATLNVKDYFTVSSSFSVMRQYLHLLTTSGMSMTSDLWLPSTVNVPPEKSDQFALGVSKTIGNTGFDISVEGYLKKMSGLVTFKEGSAFFSGAGSWEDKIETGGIGRSKGVEVLIQKSTGKSTGWISYTLSKTTRQFDNINNGNEYPFNFDRRHDLSVVMKRQLSKNIDFSASWVYGSGLPITLATGKYTAISTNHWRNNSEELMTYSSEAYIYEGKNSFRMRDYHRLDVGFNFSKEKRHGTRIWSFNIYNVYNRKNAIYYYFGETYETIRETDENGNISISSVSTGSALKQMSYFPIMPTFSYSYKF